MYTSEEHTADIAFLYFSPLALPKQLLKEVFFKPGFTWNGNRNERFKRNALKK